MTIDTKKAREMRAKGTQGEWTVEGVFVCSEAGHSLAQAWHDDENGHSISHLIAYAVNQLVPMAERIEELEELLVVMHDKTVLFARAAVSGSDEDIKDATKEMLLCAKAAREALDPP